MTINGDHGAHPTTVFALQAANSINVIRACQETPRWANILHFNNAGTALMPECAIEAVIRHLELEGMIGGYEAAERKEDMINRLYNYIAGLINCQPQDVAIVESATGA
jgi:cysteine desulfurase/selenocysteine lyase